MSNEQEQQPQQPEEVWKAVASDPQYQVSTLGRVRHGPRMIKPFRDSKNYLQVEVYYDEKRRKVLVHKLVALAFIPNPCGKPMVDHVNGNPMDNRAVNLRWATAAENAANRSIFSSNESGFRGVYKSKRAGKWCAAMCFEGVKHRLGEFDTAMEAAEAFSATCEQLYGEFHRVPDAWKPGAIVVANGH